MTFHSSETRRQGYSLKTCLYAVIVLLGLLPVVSSVLGVLAVQGFARDNARLDRAVRGTIHLEHINGIVYAVVMESRGIYMSPDWSAAEPFAKNLLAKLNEMREHMTIWQQDAITAQQVNIDALSQRIEDFIRFRSEVVRLAREESNAAARAAGDNDKARTLRMSLNNNLSVLARAYEQEISRARARVEADERTLLAALAVLAFVACVALCAGVVMVRRSLLTPLLHIKDRMLQLARGDIEQADDRRHRATEIDEMTGAVAVFRRSLIDRRQMNRENRLLSELNEWLQSSNSLSELYEMVGEFLSKLLPGCAGTLHIYANSRDVLETAKVWNGAEFRPAMHPEDCWGLRRGRVYEFGHSEMDFPCSHISSTEHADRYCCIPILAHGETIGLLHLAFAAGTAEAEIVDQRRLGLVCAEQISLAIANVQLRDQLRDQSIRDVLTGLYNRRYMLETCRREFARGARTRQPVSLLSIDVDFFKKYNDNHGHDAGDTVLRAVGGCLQGTFRGEDVACRFGGEEFVVVMPGAALDKAVERAEQLRAKIESLVVRYLEDNLPRITISVGVAAFPDAGDNPETVLKAADEALYLAKEKGRNRVETKRSRPAPAPSLVLAGN